jgi:hypothetical protein
MGYGNPTVAADPGKNRLKYKSLGKYEGNRMRQKNWKTVYPLGSRKILNVKYEDQAWISLHTYLTRIHLRMNAYTDPHWGRG